MQWIAPDILETIVGGMHDGLSTVTCAVGLVLGLLLWLFGWWGHRFWIVLFTTVAAGIFGLSSGKASGVTPIVAGLLLAVSAGMMALALARVIAFVAGCAAVCLVLQWLVPSWDNRLLCFLGGGLTGLLLFRVWMMALTSLTGTLMMAYFGLGLLDRLGKMDALIWTEPRANLLNWSCAGVALLGLLVQFLLERVRKKLHQRHEEQAHLRQAQLELDQRFRKKSWWKWGDKNQRQAA